MVCFGWCRCCKVWLCWCGIEPTGRRLWRLLGAYWFNEPLFAGVVCGVWRDEATSWNQVVRTAADAFEAAVDKRKPMITVWAEQKRSMLDNRYEWSFGSDAARGLADGGYPMMAAGRVLHMGLSTTNPHTGIAAARVNIAVNGWENPSYSVTKPPGQDRGISIFSIPLALQQGDKVNLRSASSTPEIASAVVSLIIELDL